MQLQRIQPFGAASRPSARPARVPGCGALPARRVGRCRAVTVQASAKAGELLEKAKKKYEEGDRLQAMNLYEAALNEEPTIEQKRAALFGVTAVHASFGDVELAQMTLREGIRNGLEYEKALEDPTYVTMVTSQQITIQLRRFAQQLAIAMANRPPTERPYGSTARRAGSGGAVPDLDAILGSSSGDTAEVDTSVLGIIRRVIIVVLVGVGLGVGLWFLGLEYMFPKDM
ncbi:hypothetical protein CHLRE_06g278104v5 [Chlamydomonas reinhardtii]|uniref:Uncharacterized protein n=1 Tax=Chlamydomonas reinhardtii TaxID=3055 RepID=A0A2K3DNW8_CHLRE|nr:uncharacterized protein CHLRE_06g278104v5 [Chlamydomonas reinhardtii]PNW82210.1 hypothetical protein CHLRE_06g278104v5 [Chlamydomonas reinhardtii]